MRILPVVLLAFATSSLVGCMDNWQTRQSQLRTQQIYRQSKSLAQERDRLASEGAQLDSSRQALQQQLDVANRRVANLQSTNSQMEQRFAGYLDQAGKANPLPANSTRRFEEWARKYPSLDFNPQTGVSNFHSDLLFNSGSDAIKSGADRVLKDFVAIMNDPETKNFNILVVGHTDDKLISKSSTRSKHPTNWHLSTNRANSVVVQLSKLGLKDSRMGVAGYSKYQPVVPNKSDIDRRKNRRVEIFVLAPDAVVAEWNPGSHRR